MSADRPHILYVSYDGIGEPLGRSQVLAYLARLATSFEITLISFEKPPGPTAELRAELAAIGIDWRPLDYHKRPPVLSTALDVLTGRRAAIRAARRRKPDIVHVRSYVPALIALAARSRTGGRLVFDIRGFWADERVEGGLWPAGGLLYRIAKRYERRFFAEADGIVTLTEASVPQIRAWARGEATDVTVIPTCVELERFSDRPPRPAGPHAVWSGSVGTWYRFDLAAPIGRALGLPLTVITRQEQLAHELLGGHPAEIRAAEPQHMPGELFAGDVGLCLIRSSFSKTASAPTRFAEYLAAGMPVIVTPGVGDLEAIVEDDGVGVVLRSEDPEGVRRAAEAARAMAADPVVRRRCCDCARRRFDVRAGSASYERLYRRLLGD